MNIQLNPDHYLKHSYDFRERFISYWYQINKIFKLNPVSILEIGIGNGFVSNYLKARSYKVTTLDINPNFKTDVVSSVLSIPFPKQSIDLTACYEVLEHLPYKNFLITLSEIYRVCRNNAIISLPDSGRVY